MKLNLVCVHHVRLPAYTPTKSHACMCTSTTLPVICCLTVFNTLYSEVQNITLPFPVFMHYSKHVALALHCSTGSTINKLRQSSQHICANSECFQSVQNQAFLLLHNSVYLGSTIHMCIWDMGS